jgi:hypothetical protein
MGSYVRIDLHRQRSVVVVLNDDGERVSWSRIDNTPVNLAGELTAAGPGAEVAMEARWGWHWAADVIAECGNRLHLAHPLGIAGYADRRVKNDIADATLLADPVANGTAARGVGGTTGDTSAARGGPLPGEVVPAAQRIERPGSSNPRQRRRDPRDQGDLVVRWATLARRPRVGRRLHQPDRIAARPDRVV